MYHSRFGASNVSDSLEIMSGTGLVPQSPEGRLTLQYSFTVRFIFANTLICWIFESSEAE